MDLTDELARLQRRMDELQAETERLTQELERLGRELDDEPDQVGLEGDGTGSAVRKPDVRE